MADRETLMPRPRKPKQPSESYAARVARDRRTISIGLPEVWIVALDNLAAARGETRAQTIQAALLLLDDASR